MHRYQVMLALALAVFNSACGAMGQQLYGFTERAERKSTRTRQVRIADLPADAYVDRLDPDGTVVPMKSRIDRVPYEVHETVEVPRSRVPMYVGTGLDFGAVALSGWYFSEAGEDERVLAGYALAYSISAAIADLAFSIYYSIDQQPTVVGYEPAESKRVTYVGYLGDDVRRATIDVALVDRLELDFSRPPEATDVAAVAPGGPRLGATLPTPPHAPLGSIPLPRTEPPPEVEESWYGWQTLPIDVLSVVGLIYGVANEDYELAVGFGAVHLAAVPLVHLAHGDPETAGASVGLRLGAAAGTGALGALIGLVLSPILLAYAEDGTSFFEVMGVITAYSAGYGFVIGSPLISILDGALLAWEPDETEPRLEIVPAAGRTDDGRPTLGFAGRF